MALPSKCRPNSVGMMPGRIYFVFQAVFHSVPSRVSLSPPVPAARDSDPERLQLTRAPPARVGKFSLPLGRFAKESGLTSPVDNFRASNRNRGSATFQHQCPKEAQQQALCPAFHYFHLRSLTCLQKLLPLASNPHGRAWTTVSSPVFCPGLVPLALRPTVSPECMLASSAGASFSATSSNLRLVEPVAGRTRRN